MSPSNTPARPRHAYQLEPASSDRSTRCPNRNGIWPPLYKRQWQPHPTRSQSRYAQREWERCVRDAVADGELHRTTGDILLAFSRASDDHHNDVWIGQTTVGQRLGLAASTVCHHMTIARRAGWIAVQHRNRIDHGVVLGMTNVTRFELPERWRERLLQQTRDRRAQQTKERRSRNNGRVTEPSTKTTPQTGRDDRPSYANEAQQADATGAATALSADTTTFEQGRLQLENQYRGQAQLYERAYAAYVDAWQRHRSSVRLNV
jgi:hypothetical protein